MINIFRSKHIKKRKKRYYREWMKACGWGVMLDYDTVWVESYDDAERDKPFGMYAYDKSFECIEIIKKEHLHLNDEELSKIYGEKEGNQ